MAILTEALQRVVREQRLGFCAAVGADGTPNLSPKGTTAVWGDDHRCFAHIRSPQTVRNLRRGSLVEINMIDPFVRKGYRFKGTAVIYERGARASRRGSSACTAVRQAHAVVSPAYDGDGRSETEIAATWHDHFARLRRRAEA